MSEEALARYIDERIAKGGGDATPPQDADTRALAGTARLAQAALSSPAPPAQAEADSRARVLAHLEDSALPPRVLHEAADGDAPDGSLLERLRRGVRRLWDR